MISLDQIRVAIELSNPNVPAQVSQLERKVLKYLASRLPQSGGALVDLGAGCGGSTVALSEGLLERADGYRPTIYAYDWFSIGPGHYTTDKFKAFSDPDDPSYLEDFRYFMSSYLDYTKIFSGDIMKFRWDNGPIDILHVDIAKWKGLFNHVAGEFFPMLHLSSILVHQDFSQPRLPWLHISVGIMREVLRPVYRTRGSVFFEVTGDITSEMIEAMTGNISLEDRKTLACRGIEHAATAEAFESDHFAVLPEVTDLYVDYWWGDRGLAARRYMESANRAAIEAQYRNIAAELERALPS